MAQHVSITLSNVSAGGWCTPKRLPVPAKGTLEGFYMTPALSSVSATQYQLEVGYAHSGGWQQQLVAHDVPAVAGSWSDSVNTAQATTWTDAPVRFNYEVNGSLSALYSSNGTIRSGAGLWVRAKILSGPVASAASGAGNVSVKYDKGPEL